MTVVSRSGSVMGASPFVSEAQRCSARGGSSIARQGQAGGEGEEDRAGRAVEPAYHARPPQLRGERAGGGGEGEEPEEAERRVDRGEQQGPAGDVAAGGDELRKKGNVEHAHLGIEHVGEEAAAKPGRARGCPPRGDGARLGTRREEELQAEPQQI